MGRARNDLTDEEIVPMRETAESRGESALLSWVQQFAPYGIITLDESFCIKTWNRWMEIHSSRRVDDVKGKDLFALFPDLRERRLDSHFERALDGESCVLSTALHQYLLPLPSSFPEPGIVHMLQTARISPLFSNGNVCGVVVVIEDVTQRENQAEALRRQHGRDEILSWALAHLLKAEEPRKTVRQLFFKVAEHLDFDSFSLYLRNPESGILSLYATGGLPPQSAEDFEHCPFRALLDPESPKMLVLDSVQERPEPEFSILKRAGVSAAVAIPLVANNRNLGLLCFSTWSRSIVAAGESDLLTTIGQYLATALDRENTSRQLHKAKGELSDHARLLEQRVQQRTAQLQESVSELETFTYTLAHDLKAPIRGMTGYCDILLDDFRSELSPRVDMIVQKLARTSRRMDTLVKDLLAFSKVSQRQVVLSRLEVEPIIEDLIAMRVPEVRHAVKVLKPLHRVIAHKELLQQVLANLIDNAWKFVKPKSEPKITIHSEVVLHSSPSTRSGTLLFNSTDSTQTDANPVEPANERIRLWVADEGIGIPPEVHHKIFGIFERGVASQTYEGTGMGLAIVARAMQRMGGTCGVESEPGKGSRFWIVLPAA
jgi:signal transduction histidine kinase